MPAPREVSERHGGRLSRIRDPAGRIGHRLKEIAGRVREQDYDVPVPVDNGHVQPAVRIEIRDGNLAQLSGRVRDRVADLEGPVVMAVQDRDVSRILGDREVEQAVEREVSDRYLGERPVPRLVLVAGGKRAVAVAQLDEDAEGGRRREIVDSVPIEVAERPSAPR